MADPQRQTPQAGRNPAAAAGQTGSVLKQLANPHATPEELRETPYAKVRNQMTRRYGL